MRVYKGVDRIAFVGDKTTVKVARTNPVAFGKEVRHKFGRGGVKEVAGAWTGLTADMHHSLKNLLLHGIVANRREDRLATTSEAIVPTQSYLGGILNIQRTVDPVGLTFEDIYGSFAEHLGPRVTKIGHMLENPSNVGISDGQARFVDGGSIGLERLLEIMPDDVMQSLHEITAKLGSQAVHHTF